MNITFLIGNGFDVGLGMKSRFIDFFPVYKEKSKNKEKRIKQLSDSIDGNYETWADFEKALGKYTLEFNSENKNDFIDQVKDFESEFIAYLKQQESNLSFENTEQISNMMINGLTQYYSTDYLAKDSATDITNVYNLYISYEHTYNFVNFNYTSLLSKSLQCISQNVVCKRKYGDAVLTDKIGKIVHVHGYCDNLPIIGVNDTNQIANKELANDLRFARYIVKPTINKYLRQGNDRDTTSVIKDSTIICVYGMSLGATDRKWWDLLMQWLKSNDYHHLVLFIYDKNYSSATPFGWLEKEDSIIDLFKQYVSNNGTSVDNMRSRIHIAVHKNIFQMNLMPKRNKNESKIMLDNEITLMNQAIELPQKYRDEIAITKEFSQLITGAK